MSGPLLSSSATKLDAEGLFFVYLFVCVCVGTDSIANIREPLFEKYEDTVNDG